MIPGPAIMVSVSHRITKKDLDKDGWLTPAGEMRVWEAIVGIPPGADFFLDVGPARYPTQRVLNLIAQEMGTEGQLHLRGPRAEAARAWRHEWLVRVA